MTDQHSDLQLEARFRRYLDVLANTPMPAGGSDTAVFAHHPVSEHGARRMAVAAVVVALAVVASVATVALTHQRSTPPATRSTTATAAVPTPCPAHGGPTIAPGLTGSQRDKAVRTFDQWYQACLAAWWANLDLSSVDWAKVPYSPGDAVGDGPGPEFGTLAAATRSADTIVVGTVASITKGQASVVFNLAVDRVLKGSIHGAKVTMIGEGGLVPLDSPPPRGIAISVLPGVAFPIPGQRVVVLGTFTASGLQPQPFSGIYFVNSLGGVSALAGNKFGSSVTGTTEAAFIAAIQSAMSAG